MASIARRLLPVALSVYCTVAIAAQPAAPKPLPDGDYTFTAAAAATPSPA